jgi:SAM-dependent methyltransferase
MSEDLVRKYLKVSSEFGGAASNWKHYFSLLFERADLEGATVLDVGGGIGRASYYAAARGAKRVICLEPEADGSRPEMIARAEEYGRRLGLSDVVEIKAATLQAVSAGTETFDVVVLHKSINHVNEAACARLQDDAEARAEYAELFGKLRALTTDGGTLIAVDCARRNLFGDLGIRNPFAPTINWEIHQSPWFWSKLLEPAGFRDPRVRWFTHNRIRGPLRPIFANALASYLYQSEFCFDMITD